MIGFGGFGLRGVGLEGSEGWGRLLKGTVCYDGVHAGFK